MRLLCLSALLPLAMLTARAQECDEGCEPSAWQARHEVFVGVGDMLFETMMWHNELQPVVPAYDSGSHSVQTVKSGYRYTPHISAGCAYYLKPWLSMGLTLNFQMTMWNGNENFYNLCIMPEIKFTYFRRENVGLYSAAAVGLDINGGTEKNIWGKNTECGAAIDLRLFGVTAGKGNWWGFCDIGGLFALQAKDRMYMLGSDMVRIGLSYRF